MIGALIAAAVLLGVFFFVEPRLREPLIELGLFANRSANGVAFAQNFGFDAMLFLLTQYLQNILGYSPLQAGLIFLTFSVVLAIVDSFASRLAVSVEAMENGRLAELLSASGANLDASDRAEIRRLLSGSAAAEQKLS